MAANPLDAWLTILSAVIVSVVANGAIILVAWWRRKKVGAETAKVDAEAADVLTGTALRIVTRMEQKVLEVEAQLAEQKGISTEQGKEIRKLQCRVKILEDENSDLRRGAERLVGQLVDAKLEPDWRPGAA
jgi:cell division protein FtsB